MDVKAVEARLRERVLEALEKWGDDDRHPVPSPSGIARCFRQQWCRGTRHPITNPDQPAWAKKMEQGKLVEPFWHEVFQMAGFTVATLNERVPVAGGPMTGVGDRMLMDEVEALFPGAMLLELKDLGMFTFYEFLKYGLKEGNPDYYYQVQCYMAMYAVPFAIVFAGQADASSTTWWWRTREKKEHGPEAAEWPPPFLLEIVPFAPADFAWAQQRAVDVDWYIKNVAELFKVPRH